MSSFIDRWINRMNASQAHNSRPMNTYSYQTMQTKQSGNSPVYFKQKEGVATSPNLLNTPVAYFEQDGFIPKEQLQQMDSNRRKSSVGSMEGFDEEMN